MQSQAVRWRIVSHMTHASPSRYQGLPADGHVGASEAQEN